MTRVTRYRGPVSPPRPELNWVGRRSQTVSSRTRYSKDDCRYALTVLAGVGAAVCAISKGEIELGGLESEEDPCVHSYHKQGMV